MKPHIKYGMAKRIYRKRQLKYFISLTILLFGVSFEAHAFRRYVEIGLDLGAGFANNFIGLSDIFQQNIVIDLSELNDRINRNGIELNADLAAKTFININPRERWGFGFSSGITGGIYGNIPKSLINFIAEGNINQRSFDGEFAVSGGVFWDTTISFHSQVKDKVRIRLAPSLFIPLIYIPRSSFNYFVNTDNSLELGADGKIVVYSFIPFEQNESQNANQRDLIFDTAGNAYGIDLSFNIEYGVHRIVDLGFNIINVPLIPATLDYGMEFTLKPIDIAIDINREDIDLQLETDTNYFDGVSQKIVRPLRFDIYASITPLSYVRIKPLLGITLLTPAKTPYLNATVDLELFTKRFFLFYISTGYEERLWRHKTGFSLDLRVFELILEAGLSSQDLAGSLNLRGFSFATGMRFGF